MTNNEKIRAALEFYADRENWTGPTQINADEHYDSSVSFALDGHGRKAREALALLDTPLTEKPTGYLEE